MKITKKILQDIIKEELEKALLSEESSAQTYEKTIKSLIKFQGVEGALVQLAYLVGAMDDAYRRLIRDKN